MTQKPLNLLTMDTLTLEHCYTRPTDKRYADLIGAFYICDNQKPYTYSSDGIIVRTDPYARPNLLRNVKSLGVTIELNVLSHTGMKWNSTLPEIAEQHPQVHKELMKLYRKGWLEEYNQILINQRNTYVESVDKLYNELITIHTTLGYKSDLATLTELDDLLYCEAEGFLLKMEEKIDKKNNPKNLKLYKALKALRDESIITCESA